MRFKRIQHRVTQFFHTLSAPLRPLDEAYAARHLSPTLLECFQAMPRAEQHHSIAVCRALETQGYHDADLLTAALLHDVGKSLAPLWIGERVAVVLVEHYTPTLAKRWSQGEASGWRRGFVVRQHHPEWGADLVAQAGASSTVVELIRQHHNPPGDNTLLAALQAVDEA